MIKVSNSHAGLSWPADENKGFKAFELKFGDHEYEDVPKPILERLKQMHEDRLIVLDLPGFKFINNQWVPVEATPSTIEHAPTVASPDASTTGKDGAAAGSRMIDDKNVAPQGKPTEKK